MDQSVIEDLNLQDVFSHLIEINEGDEAIVYQLCQDIETIEYRQSIMKDFIAQPKLLTELAEHLKTFKRFRFKFEKEVEKSSKIYYLIELLIVVEASVECLEALFETLKYYRLESKGLLDLRNSVEEMMVTDTYKQMKVDMKAIRYIFKGINSVEVSVNMNTGMRPYEAQVTMVNEHKYRYPKAFRQVSDALDRTERFLGRRTKHYVPVFPVDRVNLDLLEEIEYALKEHRSAIQKFLTTYNKVDALPFINLHEEVTFYEAGMNLYNRAKSLGLTLNFPEISKESCFSILGAYNLNLGITLGELGVLDSLVNNEFDLSDEKHVVLLTGSNRGGKTTFTQLVGQIQVLAQLGFMVPAQEAKISLVDIIMTHFPLIEQASVDHGRFGKACLDFRNGFKKLSSKSLLLMNESFSGTSHLESVEVASEVIRALSHKGIRTFYNTHLHALYEEVEAVDGVISYSVGEINTSNMFKVYASKPRGYSQAIEIAKSFGVTYDQLVNHIGGEEHGA